jgi:hypothetical protein
LHEIRRLQRNRAAASEMTMIPAGATGSLTMSVHPAARRIAFRTEGTTKKAPAANASTNY